MRVVNTTPPHTPVDIEETALSGTLRIDQDRDGGDGDESKSMRNFPLPTPTNLSRERVVEGSWSSVAAYTTLRRPRRPAVPTRRIGRRYRPERGQPPPFDDEQWTTLFKAG